MPVANALASALEDLAVEQGLDNLEPEPAVSLTAGYFGSDYDGGPVVGPIWPCSCCMGCFC
jgi:hypothetical protein